MANQIGSQPYSYVILGDGTSTSVSFDIKSVAFNQDNDALQLSNPDSIYLQNFNGSPLPLPNITSLTVSGSVVTVNFDAVLTLFDIVTQDGMYNIEFYLGFNA